MANQARNNRSQGQKIRYSQKNIEHLADISVTQNKINAAQLERNESVQQQLDELRALTEQNTRDIRVMKHMSRTDHTV